MRELRRIKRNLEGIRTMDKMPGALVIIDVNRELNALREARILGIPTIALIDTDGDPDLVDIPIPGNDDSMRSIEVIIRELAAAVNEGKTGRQGAVEAGEEEAERQDAQRGQRRSSRSQFRAEQAPASPAGGEAQPQPEKAESASATSS